MPKFRKKPVVIEAVQYLSDIDIRNWIMGQQDTRLQYCADSNGPFITIETLEGTMRADVGDWIIRGIQNELYPCKPDIFAATYDAVE